MQNRQYDYSRDGSRVPRQQFRQALKIRPQFVEGANDGTVAQFDDVRKIFQWRVSARPADVVLSVMGLLGVTLDPSQFKKDDRFGATVALAQQLLCKEYNSKRKCIEVPLWRRISKRRLDEAGKVATQYMASTLSRVRF